jgi:hypothetical protein
MLRIATDIASRRHAALASALLFGVLGGELVMLATWLPDTLGVFADPARNGYGDFPIFYRNAASLAPTALYSPGLSLLMHPLSYLPMRAAFDVYGAVNLLALVGVAAIAQAGVRSWPAKLAIVLGMVALPQTHWSFRIGHFTQVLAFSALAGLLLAERRPVAAGLLMGMLALKPQYLPVPLIYLAFSRNWRALGACLGSLGALAVVAVCALAVRDGDPLGVFAQISHYYHAGIADDVGFLTVGQRDQLYPQGWQYSWYGFLLSAGIEPNPLVAAELFALSVAVTALAWVRCTPSVAKAAAALAMLLLAPHSTFYNWSMLSVAAALLLHSDLRPRWLVAAMLGGLALAACASQNATPFPLPVDLYRPASTDGLYWVQPAAFACIAAAAIVGRRGGPEMPQEPRAAADDVPSRASRVLAAPAMLVAGVIAAAWVVGAGPFASPGLYSRADVLAALPDDFPPPPAAGLGGAGAGSRLPYRIDWHSDEPVSAVAGAMRERLADGSWRVVDERANGEGVSLRAAREAAEGDRYVGELSIVPDGQGSRLRLEFAPLPISRVPSYDRWLESIGIVVHNIDPASPAASVTPTT